MILLTSNLPLCSFCWGVTSLGELWERKEKCERYKGDWREDFLTSPTTKRTSDSRFLFSLTFFWREAVEPWGLCVCLGYDLMGKSMWHLGCFCKCYLGAWLSGKSQVGGLVLAQVLANTGFPFLNSSVVLQWPDEAMHKTKHEVAQKYQQKYLEGGLSSWLTWVLFKVPPAPWDSVASENGLACAVGTSTILLGTESYEVLWCLWSQKIIVMLTLTSACFPWEGFQYAAFVKPTAIFQSAAFIRQ